MQAKNYLVANLILIFSVVIPVLKGIFLLVSLIPGHPKLRHTLVSLVKRIGKWSMADVFVVAIFLAYLATASMQVFEATLQVGFYYFLAYCILSVLSTEFILLNKTSSTDK